MRPGIGLMYAGAGPGEPPPETFTVSGTVLDALGDPYVGVDAAIERNGLVGGPIQADGTFAIAELPADGYVLRVTPNTGDTDHIETYYDGSLTQEFALPVDVSGDVSGLTIQLLPSGLPTSIDPGDLDMLTWAKANLPGALTLDPVAWVPTDAAGLVAWYDASDPATIHEDDNAGFVSAWDDKSGNDRHMVNATAATQPSIGDVTINGLNTISFVASPHQRLDATGTPPMLPTQPWWCAAVVQSSEGAAIFDAGFVGGRAFVTWGGGFGGQCRFWVDGSEIDGGSFTADEPVLLVFIADGASSSIRQNGVEVVSGDTGASGLGVPVFPSPWGGQNINHAEVVFATGAFDPEVEPYLVAKFGFTGAIVTAWRDEVDNDLVPAEPLAFVPADYGTVVTDIDFSVSASQTLVDDRIVAIADQSGNGNDLVLLSGEVTNVGPLPTATLGDLSAAHFDSRDASLTTENDFVGPLTIAYMVDVFDSPGVRVFQGLRPNDVAFNGLIGAAFLDGEWQIPGWGGTVGPVAENKPTVIMFVWEAPTSSLYVDGVLVATTNPIVDVSHPLFPGIGGLQFVNHVGGQFTVWDGDLSADAAAISDALHAKWRRSPVAYEPFDVDDLATVGAINGETAVAFDGTEDMVLTKTFTPAPMPYGFLAVFENQGLGSAMPLMLNDAIGDDGQMVLLYGNVDTSCDVAYLSGSGSGTAVVLAANMFGPVIIVVGLVNGLTVTAIASDGSSDTHTPPTALDVGTPQVGPVVTLGGSIPFGGSALTGALGEAGVFVPDADMLWTPIPYLAALIAGLKTEWGIA
jgi:hypothetical protein